MLPPSASLPHDVSAPSPVLSPLSAADALALAKRGYVTRAPLLPPELADALPFEIDRLIGEGLLLAAPDRIVDGQPTEWVSNLGTVWGADPDGEILRRSPLLRRLSDALAAFGASYDAARTWVLRAGVDPREAPLIAPSGMELVVNRVVGTAVATWSGLHLHKDTARFTRAMRAFGPGSLRHAAVRARALTVSGYARPLSPEGERRDDLGGALPFVVRAAARHPGDQAVFDIVAAHHNTGAVFFPHTTHGVGSMPAGGVRYSFQAFFPAREAWSAIEQRIEAGELRRELDAEAARRGAAQ